jgi:hypothetical protein
LGTHDDVPHSMNDKKCAQGYSNDEYQEAKGATPPLLLPIGVVVSAASSITMMIQGGGLKSSS